MKTTILVRPFIVFVCAIALVLSGLTLMLSSCREISIDFEEVTKPNSDIHSGSDGKLKFFINFGTFGINNNDPTTRSSAALEAETVTIPLDDGLSLTATLEPATGDIITRSVGLRAFENNTRMHIVAYEVSAGVETYIHHATFVVNTTGGATLIPGLTRDIGEEGFQLYTGRHYRFIAYAYNDNTRALPASSPTIPDTLYHVNPNMDDLIWGETLNPVFVNGVDTTEINIIMQHKFSKVNLEASSASVGSIYAIDGVTMYGYEAHLAVDSGKLISDGITIPMNFGFLSSSFPTASATFSRIVYTAEDNQMVIHIDSVNIGSSSPGNKYKNLEATFARQLKSGYVYNLKLNFGDAKQLTDDASPANFVPYIGAFWKHNQTGERLIRMARPTVNLLGGGSLTVEQQAVADGFWTAEVVSGASWIVLDTIMTTDTNVGWLPGATESGVHNGNDLSFDTNHTVGSTLTRVGGTMNTANPQIYFRIGLKSTIGPTNHRYGVVLLTYGNNEYRQRIFVRQGEAADFVMGPNDAVGGGPWGTPYRPAAIPFSTYNLTAAPANLNGPVRNTYGSPPSTDPAAIFTDYPSQAGAYFQWASDARTRYAWDPFSATFAGTWQDDAPATYWTDLSDNLDLAAIHETCPIDYRRPNDGITNNNSTGIVAGSEMRQSLYLNPKPGMTNDVDTRANSIHGYYADGFFDRRQIGNNSAYQQTAVSVGDEQIAYSGWLFYNPSTYASLFFPATGFRNYDNGAFNMQGGYGHYATSSANSTIANWHLNMYAGNMSLSYTTRSTALPIRCVWEECVGVNAVIAGRTGGSGLVSIGNSVTLTATGITASATKSIQYLWEVSFDSGLTWQVVTDGTSQTCTTIINHMGNNLYKVTATNTCGSASNTVVVVGDEPPYGGSAARITWDDAKQQYALTHDPRYAGLYFKFGSLVGVFTDHESIKWMAPPLTPSIDPFHPANDIPYNITTTVINTWTDIPYIDSPVEVLINDTIHNVALVMAGRGDPCRLIGLDLEDIKSKIATSTLAANDIENGKWRLPTHIENMDFAGYNYNPSTGLWWWNTNQAGNISFGVPGAELPERTLGGTSKFMPAIGWRGYNNGAADAQGNYGYYWTSESPGNNGIGGDNQAHAMVFNQSILHLQSPFNPACGMAVRCVPQQHIMLTPDTILLAATSFTPTLMPGEVIEVTTLSATTPWTLTVPASQSWLRITTNPNGTGGTASITSMGSKTVYLVVDANLAPSARTTVISLDGSVQTIFVEQEEYIAGGYADRVTWDAAANGGTGGYIITSNYKDAGLYFKFGSVVGIFSGTGNSTQILPTTNTSTFTLAHVAWSPVTTITDWTSIPFVTSPNTTIDNVYHNLANVRAGRGDPCRLVGLDLAAIANLSNPNPVIDNNMWRLPTIPENTSFMVGSSVVNSWWSALLSPFGPGIAGYELPVRNSNNGIPNPAKFFICNGQRENINGQAGMQNTAGYYWGNESHDNANPNGRSDYLSFDATKIAPTNPPDRADRGFGFGVRCVRR